MLRLPCPSNGKNWHLESQISSQNFKIPNSRRPFAFVLTSIRGGLPWVYPRFTLPVHPIDEIPKFLNTVRKDY